MDRRLWQIGVLGSEFQIGVLVSECLDRHVWIGVLLTVLESEFQIGAVLGSECSCVAGSEFQIGVLLAVEGFNLCGFSAFVMVM